MQYKHIGQLLIEKGLIDKATLKDACKKQKKSKDKLGKILVDMEAVTEEALLTVLSRQLKLPYIDLFFYDIDTDLMMLLPERHAREYNAIVLGKPSGELLVGMVDPLDINAVDAIAKMLKQPIKTALISERALLVSLDRIYRHTSEIRHFAKELSSEIGNDLIASTDTLFEDSLQHDEERAPVVSLLNSLFRDALQAGASDIHIEPDQVALRIRLRVDGVLNEYMFDEKSITAALVQRLKLRANLDISEHRIPLDGSFSFEMNDQSYDVRLSTVPTVNGESMVMRLLKQSQSIGKLGELGIDEALIKRIEAIYKKPFGMLLVTGPTGSGKSTTLYSILSNLNTAERKIITVEDPVEYRITRVNQVQVNAKIDLTFARVLRAVLRQDPDVIMIGEIRDTETAMIAMRAAITGHFVLATMHTNDALSSALRLMDMGSEGFMVAAALKAIIGQRLVRNLCQVCMKDHEPDEFEKTWLTSMNVDAAKIKCKDAEGCSHCGMRGYAGRTGIYELLELNPDMIKALRLNDVSGFAKAAHACETYQPLSQSVLALVKQGITSVNEAIRVVGQLDTKIKPRE